MFSLTLYWDGEPDNWAHPRVAPPATRSERQMNTTQPRKLANPRRITLAHLDDASTLGAPERPEHTAELPARTANPRRTILR